MSLLKNIGDKAMSTAKMVGSKSQDAVEIGKLKLQISQLEGDIKKLKLDIGEEVYSEFVSELATHNETVVSLCNNINEKNLQIEELKLKIEGVKND